MQPRFEAKKPFDAATWIEALAIIVKNPPPDSVLDTALTKMVQDFVAAGDRDPAAVWNFYKKMLDMMVRYAGGDGFMMKFFDLEPHYAAPAGGYTHADGTMSNAPWRREHM
jgi:hypothetical protein